MVASRQLGRQRWQRALASQMHSSAARPTAATNDTLPPQLEAELAALQSYVHADQTAILVDVLGRRTVMAVAGDGPLTVGDEFLARVHVGPRTGWAHRSLWPIPA
jgi:hypothetical protein